MSSFKDFKDFEVGDNVQVVMEYYSYEGIIKGEVNGYYVVESEIYGIQKIDSDMLRHVLPINKISSFTPTDKMKYLLTEIYKVNLINEDEYKLGQINGNICSMFISLYRDKMYSIRYCSTSKTRSISYPISAIFGSSMPLNDDYLDFALEIASHTTPSSVIKETEEDYYNSGNSFSLAGYDDDDNCAPGLFGDMWSKSSRSSGFSSANGDEDEEDDLRPGCGW